MPKLTLKAEKYTPHYGQGYYTELQFKELHVDGFDGTPFGSIRVVIGDHDLQLDYCEDLRTVQPSTANMSKQLVSSLYGEDDQLVLGSCTLYTRDGEVTDIAPHERNGGFVFNALLTQLEKTCGSLGLKIPKVNSYSDNYNWGNINGTDGPVLTYGTGRQNIEFVSRDSCSLQLVNAYYDPTYVLQQIGNTKTPECEAVTKPETTDVVWVSSRNGLTKLVRQAERSNSLWKLFIGITKDET